MYRISQRFAFVLLLLSLLLIITPFASGQESDGKTVITVSDDIVLPDAKRLGVNLGHPNQYGAAQYLKNIIYNPGFEAGEFGTIFLTTTPSGNRNRIQQDNWSTAWNRANIGQPEGFWNNANYEVVNGNAIGRFGNIANFTHEDGRYTYYLENDGTAVGASSVVFMRKTIPGYEANRNPFAIGDPNNLRENTTGRQSLKLLPSDPEWRPSFAYYMDSSWRDADTAAGKLLLINGMWHFEIWARSQVPNEEIEIAFFREREVPFFQETLELTTEWQKYELDFYVDPELDTNGDNIDANSVLGLTIKLLNGQNASPVWIDDAYLARTTHNNPTVFTDRFVNLLRELNPGIVRNWGSQLGSSLDNQISDQFARRTTAHRPDISYAGSFHFSLHEFLELAKLIDSEPWYVIPPTFTATEMQNLVAYLSAPVGTHEYADRRAALGQTEPWTDVFPTMHLEYGNEMWGSNDGTDQFIGATLRGGIYLGQIANQRLGYLRASPYFQPNKMNLIIGGQDAVPERQGEIERNSVNHDTIAVAPYFGELDTYSTDEEIFYPLFAGAKQDVASSGFIESKNFINAENRGTDMAVYEVNFHSTFGRAPLSTRNGFVTGLNGGLALPLYMLSFQRDLGVRNQAAFTAVQFSVQIEDGEYARVWGMMRDLEATARKRPTWLGTELANRAIRGDMVNTTHSGANPIWTQTPINDIKQVTDMPFVQSFAFRDGDSYAMVLFNLHLDDTQNVVLNLPQAPDSEALQHVLTSKSIHHTNEPSELIRIRTEELKSFSQSYEIALPPHSVYVLEWGTTGRPPIYSEPTPTPEPAVVITDQPVTGTGFKPTQQDSSRPIEAIAAIQEQSVAAVEEIYQVPEVTIPAPINGDKNADLNFDGLPILERLSILQQRSWTRQEVLITAVMMVAFFASAVYILAFLQKRRQERSKYKRRYLR